MRSRVTALTRPGIDSARETVDAATPAASATSLIVAGLVAVDAGAGDVVDVPSKALMLRDNHIWQILANSCQSCGTAPTIQAGHPNRCGRAAGVRCHPGGRRNTDLRADDGRRDYLGQHALGG